MNSVQQLMAMGHFPNVRDETANNVSEAYIPKFWAFETIRILQANLVMANLVHRDFSPMLQNYGDTVNTRIPATFTSKRKGLDDEVEIQPAQATNVPVKLDQHWHVSFMLRDGEMSKAFKNLVTEYLEPAVIAQAEILDRILLAQYVHFLPNATGMLGGLDNTNSKRGILNARRVMNINRVPDGPGQRNLIWTPYSETEALDNDMFLTADKVGDDGTALREASLGRKLGFDHYMSQLAPYVDPTDSDIGTGAVNNTGGYAAGASSIDVDGMAFDVPVGSYVFVAGDDQPKRVASRTYSSPNTTALTFDSPLSSAVADNAVVTVAGHATINKTGGYLEGHYKYIALDGFASGKFLQAGQGIRIGNYYYTVVDVINASGTSQEILLDRPLEADVADDASVFPLPPGNYNFFFHRNALSLVIRPLEAPMVDGVIAETINVGGFTARVVISYLPQKQGHLVTIDFLAGVKVLQTQLGGVLLG